MMLYSRSKFVFRRPRDGQLVRFDVDVDKAQYVPVFLTFESMAIVEGARLHKMGEGLTEIAIESLPVAATFFSVLGLVDHMICRGDLFSPSFLAVCARHVHVNRPAILRL